MALTIVLGAGIVLGAACWQLGRVPDLALAPRAFLALFALAFVAYAIGAAVAARLRGHATLAVILLVGGVARAVLLPAPPTLSTDAYRYVWDARVAAAGLDPYAHAPADAAVAALRDAHIHPRLNHPTWRTVYPPLAQAFFRAVYRLAPDSVAALKLAFALAELVALACLGLLLRTLALPAGRLAIYAWNPLVLVEIWGDGHLDALVLAAVTAAALASARRRDVLAAGLLAVGALLKLYPAVLLLLLPGRRRPAVLASFAGTFVAASLAVGGIDRWPLAPIGRYVAEEHFNPGLVRSFVDAPVVALAATAAWVALAAWRAEPSPLAVRAVPMIAGYVLLLPNVFPWYAVWLVPFLAVAPSWPLIAFTGTVGLAYTFFLSQPWAIPLWARLLEAAPLVVGALGRLRDWTASAGSARVRAT